MSSEEPEVWKSPFLGAGPGLRKIKGMWYPIIYLKMEPDKIEKIESFESRPEDIWLCSYPKSGTTWLQQILLYLQKDETSEETEKLTSDEQFPYLEGIVPVMDKLNSMSGQRLIKSHLAIDLLPENLLTNKSKVIYISRNVKDVSVSMYHFHQLVTNIDYKGTFENFYQEFKEGKVCYGKWSDHVLGFWKHKDADNLLFLKYEDVHKDAVKEITKIADFLEIPHQPSKIEKIAELCQFNIMKNDPMINQSWQITRGVYKDEPNKKFMRKGKVGDWKNYYSEEMSQEMDSLLEGTIKPVGLEYECEIFD